MPSESVQKLNAMMRAPKPVYALASNGEGRAKFVLLETAEPENAGDNPERERRVVDGSTDGGAGREDPPQPTKMNVLIRDLAYGAHARKMRQSG